MIIDNHVHLPIEHIPVEDFIYEFIRCGISMVMLSDLGDWTFFPSSDVIRQANDRAINYAAASAGQIKALAYINPTNDDWPQELDRCLDLVIGIKLWTSLSQDAVDFDQTIVLLKRAAACNLPVLIHTWNGNPPDRPGQIDLKRFADLARKVPECKMIAAHSGGNWRQSVGVLKGLPNTWCDVCGGYPAAGMVEQLVADIGADRILFGSDATGRSYPSQYAKVLFADVDERIKQMICSENVIKLYGLKDIPPEPVPEEPRPLEALPDMTTDNFCFCGRWPFAELGCDTPGQLEQVLTDNGITTAFTGSLDGIFKHNIIEANRKFIMECAGLPRVKPLAVLNPTVCNCSEAVSDAANAGAFGAIIYPTLHNWKLDDEKYDWLFEQCAEAGLKLWINCGIDDPRYNVGIIPHRAVGTEEFLGFAAKVPDNSYVIQGFSAPSFAPVFSQLQNDARFSFDLSRLTDNCMKLREHLAAFGKSNLVFGSEFPFRDIRTVRYCAERV